MIFSLPGFAAGMALAQRQGVKSNGPALLMGIGGPTPLGAVLAQTSIRAARRRKDAAAAEPEGGGDQPEVPVPGEVEPDEDREAAKKDMFLAVTNAANAVTAAVGENSEKLGTALERMGANQASGLLGALAGAESGSSESAQGGTKKGK